MVIKISSSGSCACETPGIIRRAPKEDSLYSSSRLLLSGLLPRAAETDWENAPVLVCSWAVCSRVTVPHPLLFLGPALRGLLRGDSASRVPTVSDGGDPAVDRESGLAICISGFHCDTAGGSQDAGTPSTRSSPISGSSVVWPAPSASLGLSAFYLSWCRASPAQRGAAPRRLNGRDESRDAVG